MIPQGPQETDVISQGTSYIPYNSVEEYGPGQTNNQATLMSVTPDTRQFTDNQEERCPILLCLDRSASMEGQAIRELEESIAQFRDDLMEDPAVAAKVDVAVITFNNAVTFDDFKNSTEFTPPLLKAEGGTNLRFAVDFALDMCEKRKDEYRSNGIAYHRPWILLITDGYPSNNTEEDIRQLHERATSSDANRRAVIFTIACGADSESLAKWLTSNVVPPGRPAKRTGEANFKDLFKWLSNSQIALSKSSPGDRVELPSTEGWEIV